MSWHWMAKQYPFVDPDPPEPAAVYLWQNGMVMVFDAEGQQVAEYQGPREEVEPKLIAAGWPPERWKRGTWSTRS